MLLCGTTKRPLKAKFNFGNSSVFVSSTVRSIGANQTSKKGRFCEWSVPLPAVGPVALTVGPPAPGWPSCL